jgi:hypothetical protein
MRTGRVQMLSALVAGLLSAEACVVSAAGLGHVHAVDSGMIGETCRGAWRAPQAFSVCILLNPQLAMLHLLMAEVGQNLPNMACQRRKLNIQKWPRATRCLAQFSAPLAFKS